MKNISNEQPQVEKITLLKANDINIAQDDGQAANMLGKHYQSELETAISETNISKSSGPDGIHWQMISNLGQRGRQRFLDIINESWRTGQLPRDRRRAIVIPKRNPSKEANPPESFRPIALTCIARKVVEK
ncbi:uncharacterized protein NPIL_22551 [Nephila pilipes]|uniref:Uncharacterized protein n=1 Tax=Nephila pilipes TaxID=299642 RepID=A0A8X6Q9W8_NEPPI|nr:uncharacterized protein NPIL_22551 [Nephila pilipes]